jgi:hypothetical protein
MKLCQSTGLRRGYSLTLAATALIRKRRAWTARGMFPGKEQCSTIPRVSILREERRRSGSKLPRALKSVKRNIRAAVEIVAFVRYPIYRGIEYITATGRVPFDPRMRGAAGRSAFADHQSQISSTVLLHSVVERYGFCFTVCYRAGLGFGRGFPFSTKPVRNRAQIVDPMIHQSQRNVAMAAMIVRYQDGPNAAHLLVVRSVFNVNEDRFAKTRDAGKTDHCEEEEEKSLEGKGINADKNHT